MSETETPKGRPGWLPHPVLSLVLAAVWLLANNSVDPGHLILGVVLGIALPWLTRPFWADAPRLHAPATALRLFVMFAYDVVIANLKVAVLVLRSNDRLRPAFLKVPLDIEDRFGIALLASMITLTPGTVSCDLSADRRTLLVHILDVEDQAGTIAEIKRRYEAPLRKVLGC